ncbi:CHAT domain-containing protein [Streptomyces sp. NBC_00525]|uniref:CHAT domain-containing protein n=1 Tax=Streptomyces sp. NBC_00525 TaxID=2903660 RepID=UPI002E81B68D|nr:CHAT domain-containing protein [Streptomyces sp. NBC_00525]WUC93349.1 CHAT domain-containing protein [Streptomyces sp. NBC_00525]
MSDYKRNELAGRVAARLGEAGQTRDLEGLLSEDAETDALRLLAGAAPAPGVEVPFDPLLLVCWTYWYRASAGDRNPAADQDALFALALRSLLRPLLPDPSVLPDLPPEIAEVEADTFLRLSGFACIVGSVCCALALRAMEDGGAAAATPLFDQALAWLLDALVVMPPDHEGFGDVSVALVAVRMQRFEALAEPDSLTAAARTAAKACALVPASHPRQGGQLPLMLDVVVRAAVLLGEPSPDRVEELLRTCGITPAPETTEKVVELRELWHAARHDPAELHAVTGLLLCTTAAENGELPALACAAVRVRAALTTLPPDHPSRGALAATLHTVLGRLGQEADEASGPAARARERIEASILLFFGLQSGEEGHRAGEMNTLLNRILALTEELALDHGLPGLPADLHAAVAFADCLDTRAADDPTDQPLERIGRYRRAFDALAPHDAGRPVYGVVLAASARSCAEIMADHSPREAAQLGALATAVTAKVAACPPTGFEPLSWLRAGRVTEAAVGALCTLTEPVWSAEAEHALDVMGCEALRALATLLTEAAASMRQEVGGDLAGISAMVNLVGPEGGEQPAVDSTVRDLRTALDRLGWDKDLREAGGDLLSARLSVVDADDVDVRTLTEAVGLLRQIYEQSDRPSAAVATRLPELLTLLGTVTSDPNLIMEAAAIQEDMTDSGRDSEPASAEESFRAAHLTALNGVIGYVLTHDQDQLRHVRELLSDLIELGEQADACQEPGVGRHRLHAESMRDLIGLVGPGGGPAAGTTDEEVEQCRRSFAAAPPGKHRGFAGTTLVRALLQRSMAVRGDDSDRGTRLVDEADSVIETITGEVEANMIALMRVMSALQRVRPGDPIDLGDLPPVADAGRKGSGTMAGLMEDVMSPLLGSFRTEDRLERNIDVLRSPLHSVWMRAHAGIAAAVRCADIATSDVDLALSLGAETVGLLERVTDRGGPQSAAEHGLLGFDGDVRGLTAMIAVNLVHSRNTTHLEALGRRLRAAAERAGRGDADDGDSRGEGGSGHDSEGREDDDALLAGLPAGKLIRAVRGPRIDAAVALHERGRGLLLARRLESRTDLGALAEAHPGLASRFTRLTAQLEEGGGRGAGRARLAGRQASAELDRLIERIRTEPGFEDFLGPLPPDRLRELTAEGPVVALNHARGLSCIAFVVTPRGATALLLDVMAQEVTDAAEQFRAAIESVYARGSRRLPPSELIAARETIHRLLGWTWHSVVEPVLDVLRRDGAAGPDDAGLPRIWWVPTGPFTALPLHAAQCLSGDCENGRCGSALDTVVSSYIPGFQTLAHARSRAARRHGSGAEHALIVAESDEVLPGSEAAARLTADAFDRSDLLIGEAATREGVLAALESAQWVQFGCHAHSPPEEPTGSWIQLPSGEELSVVDICRIRPVSTRLAVLTACGTARTSTRLTDEAVQVSSAFLLAGYPEAVGTLWEVESTRIGAFLRAFYGRAPAEGRTAARAVHHAVRELRDLAPDRPYEWAAYIHAGA